MMILVFNKLNLVEKIFTIFMTIITYAWGLIILLQLIDSIDDHQDFSIVNNYGLNALTLFVIMLI